MAQPWQQELLYNLIKPFPTLQYEITLKNADQRGLPKPVSAATAAKMDDAASDSDSPNLGPQSKDRTTDCVLEETQRILLDYITLLNGPAKTTLAQHGTGQQTEELITR